MILQKVFAPENFDIFALCTIDEIASPSRWRVAGNSGIRIWIEQMSINLTALRTRETSI